MPERPGQKIAWRLYARDTGTPSHFRRFSADFYFNNAMLSNQPPNLAGAFAYASRSGFCSSTTSAAGNSTRMPRCFASQWKVASPKKQTWVGSRI